jgi:hypothetical protein
MAARKGEEDVVGEVGCGDDVASCGVGGVVLF